MNRTEFAAATAGLAVRINLFERDKRGEFEVGVFDRRDHFEVYWAVDRTGIRYQQRFATESDALTKVHALARLEHQRSRLFRDHPRREYPTSD
ncbi:MAG: hypothetical protein HGA51_05950 [Demequinaceae bacterium]|nr:hypothetical protein [Demequinaceae bacterium]